MSKHNVKLVGIAWYRPEHYEQALAIMEDGASLPREYNGWLRLAEQVVIEEQFRGSKVVKAVIDPQHFLGWCRATDQRPNVDARTRFVNQAIQQAE
jgi:hypothetical protein